MHSLLSFLLALAFGLASASAQGVITTIAGADWVFPGDGKPAVHAPLGTIKGVAVDRNGRVYVSDLQNHIVFRIDGGGILHVVAGNGVRGFSGDGGAAIEASLAEPTGLALDAAGNLYIADSGNYRIRKVQTDGTITTIAGDGFSAFRGDGESANRAELELLQGLAVAPDGTLYLADYGNHRVRKISPSNIITTVAGNGTPKFSGDGGPGPQASLNSPTGIALDAAGNLYIADEGNNRVRKVTPAGVISTFMGGADTLPGYGLAANTISAQCPKGVAVDSDGTVYVSSACGSLVRKVGLDGIVRAVAGVDYSTRFKGDGGPATKASLDPWALAIDPASHNLYITGNERVFRVVPDGTLNSIAGNNLFHATPDEIPALQGYLNEPHGVTADAAGNVYIADSNNNRIRKVSPGGILTTIAGNDVPFGDYSGDGGRAVGAGLNFPKRVKLDAAGNVYISDFLNHRIRKITPDGRISTAAGNGEENFGGDNGPAIQASFRYPSGIAIDRSGNLFVSDTGNNRVRKVTPGGIITTVVGTGEAGFSGDNGPALQARIHPPSGIDVDAAGNLYLADEINHRIRKISAGIITTVAGNGIQGFGGDGGPATSAQLNSPSDVFVQPDGTIFIADTLNTRVRRVDLAGRITTVAGNDEYEATGDGGSALLAGIGEVRGVTVAANGNLYLASSNTNRIRAVLAGPPGVVVAPASLTFSVRAGGSVSDAQLISLTSGTQGLAFTVNTGSAPWLQVTPSSGLLPATLHVSVDPTALPVGATQGTITLTVPNGSPATLPVPVRVTVTAADPPKLSLETQSLAFSLQQGSATASTQITATNRGGGVLAFSATATTSSGGNWLSLSPASGTVTPNSSAHLDVTVNAARLAPGTYSGTVKVTAGSQTLEVPVTFCVGSSPKTLLLSQTGLTFTAVVQGGLPLPQTVGVLNTGSGSMDWQAKASTLSGGPAWLSLSPAQGSVARPFLDVSPFQVEINAAGLAAGDYYGQIQVTAPGADNSPQTVSVVLNVLPAGSNPGPDMSATSLVFTGLPGANPGSQSFLVSNVTARAVNYASAHLTQDGVNWFAHVPATALVAPSQPGRIVVQPDFTRLAPGIYRGAITLLFDDNLASIRNVNILSVVAPFGASLASKRGANTAVANCAPTQTLPQFTSLPQGFSVPAFQPVALQVRVVDNCGNPLNNGVVVTRFSNGDPELSLIGLGNGVWSGTWQPRDTSQPQVRIGVSAFLKQGDTRVGGEAQISGQIKSGAPTPFVNPGAVLNAASFAVNSSVAPGTLISIFGVRLADGQTVASTAPLPTELGGTQVLVGGRALPLRYASDGQLNAQVPYDLPVNTRHQLLVRRGVALSVPQDITAAAAQPAIFTRNQTGQGQGFITDLAGALVEPGNGARAGQAVVIYCEGLGTVSPAVTEGAAAPTPPASTTAAVGVTVDGQPTEVLFSGLTPNFAGLYQVNIVVPAGLAPNDAAPVVLTVAGQSSPPVTMAVR